MAHNRSLLSTSFRARVGAVLCFIAIVFGPSQIFPGLLALGAALEGSHTVRVGVDHTHFHLVLSHERGHSDRPDYNPRHHPQHPAHHHGPAAGVLCFLVGSRSLEPDHVANFTIGSTGERRAPISTGESTCGPGSFASPSDSTADFAATVSACLRPHDHHGPPEKIGLRQLLDSTVLLV
jgi:hypothetical protein